MTGDLSPHFSRHEFACRCCGFFIPSPVLVAGLEELRAFLGLPVVIVSGSRCVKHNAAVSKVDHSQHPLGTAADIRVAGVALSALARAAHGIPVFYIGGIGIYPQSNFLHVDVRGVRARWGFVGGHQVSYGAAWDALKAIEAAA